MKKLLLLSLLALAGSALWDTTGNAQQAVTVLPDGTGTGTFNTPGITYYILPAGQTLDCRFGTLLGAVTLSTPQTIGTGSSPTFAGLTVTGTSTLAAVSATTGTFSSTVSGAGITSLFASPPAIGSTTASTGAFTTLSASSTVSGTGFSTYLASPPAIGGTAPSTGAFTTISVSSNANRGTTNQNLMPVTTADTESGNAVTINWASGNNHSITLNGNLNTVTFSNALDGQTLVVAITNTASNYTVTWGNSIKWVAGSQPTQTVGAHTDVWTIVDFSGTYYGNVVQNF
jgi:hypothetical protein